jgi:glycosyltransferase involved in cell wall biosynthesis
MAPPRIAVLTPYFQESLAVLDRCHRSVEAQTLPCDHILVADGHAKPEIAGWRAHHFELRTPSRNYGDTPRRVAGEFAIESGYDAVVYLDADNWLRPRHVESLAACHCQSGSAICHSARTFHRFDGSVLPLLQRSDNTEHVDTSCLYVSSAAFDLLPLWGTWPPELSCIDDRMFWQAAKARRYEHAFTGALTTCYEASHRGQYHAVGEDPPPGARPDVALDRLFAWEALLSPDLREALDHRWGFSVTALVGDLRQRTGAH